MGMHVNHMHKYFGEEEFICLSVFAQWPFKSPPYGIKPKILQSASASTLQPKVTVTTLLY